MKPLPPLVLAAGLAVALAACGVDVIAHDRRPGADAGRDAGEVDAGASDAGEVDAGELDAGEVDAGEVDAGEVDAGEVDAGDVDAGEVDAGDVDAGEPDAGEPEPSCSDGTLNGLESDEDCGGTCDRCEAGRTCRGDDDCASLACTDGHCAATWDAHPRIWLNRTDLARLRGWATSTNGVWQAGVVALADRGRQLMDQPSIGQAGNQLPGADTGSADYTPIPTEAWAEIFAFESLVAPDPAVRADAAARAKTLFLWLISRASTPGDPFYGEAFVRGGRAAAMGEALAVTADWIHDALTPEERTRTRQVFLRWARLLEASSGAPVAANETRVNEPGLYEPWDPHHKRLRLALQHDNLLRLRGFALFALALDDADDVSPEPGALRAFVTKAIGRWLYVYDHALREDAAGGLPADGLGFFDESVLFPGMFAWALETAGYATDAGVARWGPQVRARTHPWWSSVPTAYLHLLPVQRGATGVFEPSWYGSAVTYTVGDPTAALCAVGLLGRAAGDEARVNAARWIGANVPAGGPARLLTRLNDPGHPSRAILAFLVSEPGQVPTDPRPALAPVYAAPGLGHVSARTSWTADARLVDFRLGWIGGALQGDGGAFDFHRRGEWLTKQRTGGGAIASSSDYQNALALVTSAADSGTVGGDARLMGGRGSQFILGNAGEPLPIATSHGDGWFYATGDAAPLYAFDNGTTRIEEITRASRELVWLQPDHLLVLDRADGLAGRAKRFWLNLPGPATQLGARVTSITPGGQQLFVTTLLPEGAAAEATVVTLDPTVDELAMHWSFTTADPMSAPYAFPSDANVPGARRLRVEATGAPARTTFLHLLEGADAAAMATPASALRSTSGASATGAAVKDWVVVSLDSSASAATVVPVPKGSAHRLVSGLTAGAKYGITLRDAGSVDELVVVEGGSLTADEAGVVVF